MHGRPPTRPALAIAGALFALVVAACTTDDGQRPGLPSLPTPSGTATATVPAGADPVDAGLAGATTATPSARPIPVEGAPPSIADMLEAAARAVVAIDTQLPRRGAFQQGGSGIGTGILVDDAGHILTNLHVVDDADGITVRLADGVEASARIVGSDPGNDLAVLHADLPPGAAEPARLGTSSAVRLGDRVFALGNPFSFDFSVSAGIVSGLHRSQLSSTIGRPIWEMIQTDAAINPGNSGGPLINQRGEVIGINTAISNPTGQASFVGIGLAVPVDTARRYLSRMIAGETIEHPQLGVVTQELTDLVAERLNLPRTAGVQVATVALGTGAADAGIRGATATDPYAGDVILALGDRAITSAQDLALALDSYEVGDTVTIVVFRAGREQVLEATLSAWPQ